VATTHGHYEYGGDVISDQMLWQACLACGVGDACPPRKSKSEGKEVGAKKKGKAKAKGRVKK